MLVFPFVAKTVIRCPILVLFDLCVLILYQKVHTHTCLYSGITVAITGCCVTRSKKRNGQSVYYKC